MHNFFHFTFFWKNKNKKIPAAHTIKEIYHIQMHIFQRTIKERLSNIKIYNAYHKKNHQMKYNSYLTTSYEFILSGKSWSKF